MSRNSSIEWCDDTWNPVTGCTEVSPGCDHCYAKTFAERWRGTPGHYFERGFDVQLRPDKLEQPLHWRKPRRIFVNSMSDLFHDQVPDEYIAHVFAVMQSCAAHTFQLLTKRHGRMRSLLKRRDFWEAVTDFGEHVMSQKPSREQHWPDTGLRIGYLPNVHLVVTAEDQQRALLRIPALLDTPAAVRGVSLEPLLGPIDLNVSSFIGGNWLKGLDWVIVGGESGPGARPMHPDWARSLRDQCTAAGVPFLFKQWGEHVTVDQMTPDAWRSWDMKHGNDLYHPDVQWRVGKKRAGRLLDGRTWDEFPQVVAP